MQIRISTRSSDRLLLKGMSPKNNPESMDEMRDECDFSGGVRGKFYDEYIKGTNVVLLHADVARGVSRLRNG